MKEKNLNHLNGHLMSKDTIIGLIKNGNLEIQNYTLAPLFFQRNSNLETWLKIRAIDAHRTHSRILRRMLRIGTYDDVGAALYVNAATLTDNFWIKEENSDLTYADIRFKDNELFSIALQGDISRFSETFSTHSPELTNTGSFEKCWKKENNEWWMYKKGTKEELFSEQFTYELGKMLGFDMAQYQLTGNYIRTKDFTENGKYNFEAISGTKIADNVDYNDNYNYIANLSEAMAGKYIQMLYLDTLVYNVDRHTDNYGFLREPNTGAILDLAPNFDNNMSLIAREHNIDIERKKDVFLNFFTDFLQENYTAKKHFWSLHIPKLTMDHIHYICENIDSNMPAEKISRFVFDAQVVIAHRLRSFEREHEHNTYER